MLHGGKRREKKQTYFSVRKGAALLIAAVMLFSVMPSSVFAVESNISGQGGIESISATVPLIQAPSVTTLTSGPVTVSGVLPEGAYLEVEAVSAETAQALLEQSETDVLFAYDIKIMLPGSPSPTEYQPDADNPVTVTITPDTPTESPVEVIHIAGDKATGEAAPETVAIVTPSETGAVEFKADAFSVYVVRIMDTTSVYHTVNFPVGDYTVEYSTSVDGTFKVLTLTSVTLGSSGGTKYNTLYFKVTPNVGFAPGTVTASSGTLTSSAGVYSLSVSGAATSINVTIPVTGIKITGSPAAGQLLTAAPSDNLSGLTYAWQSCDTATGTFSAIAGQTAATLTLIGTVYNDKYIRVFATDGTNTYTSAAVGPIAEDNDTVIFDLSKSFVALGLLDGANCIYRGMNSAGALVTGVHANTNKYMVVQSNSGTATENSVILLGNPDIPVYDVTLNGINCETSTTKNSGGIIANALSATPMEIVLRLQGSNSVGRIHYATGEYDDTSVSKLKITSASGDGSTEGSLTAISSTPWSAAIGGIDDGSQEAARNITIAGGTIIASTSGSANTGTSAIGGGGNGFSDIAITGGKVTASNCGTGATIGGGGGRTSPGGGGYVTISGGTIEATNSYVNGAAIGGGASIESTGSFGQVTITGGNVTANGSIGGGNSENASGGAATVEISGGNVSVTKGIGGGNSENASGGTATITISGGTISAAIIGGGNSTLGSGGSATVNISGGTVATPHISGGKNFDGTYNDATLSIAAASVNIDDRSNINSVTGPAPDSGMASVVYCQTININRLTGFSGTIDNCHIDSASLTDGHTYELNDVYTDTSGLLYFWLPTQYSVTQLTIDDVSYSVAGALVQVATITHSSSTVGSVLGAALNHGTPTAYRWQRSVTGTEDADDWSDITGANAQSYTTTNDDLGKYVRVIITNGSDTITSGSLHITNTPHASITYTSLKAPTTLRAQLLNGSGGAYSYEWQMYNTTTEDYDTLPGETKQTIQIEDYSYFGKRVRVIITDGTNTYTTSFVYISPPTLNVTIPLGTVVTINAAGECTVSSGSILNNTDVPVYVTGVSFAWVTGGTADADELFTAYTAVTARLTLNSTQYDFTGAAPLAQAPSAANGLIAAKVGDTPGSLATPWTFILNTSKIKLVPAMGTSLHVATVTYTVDYEPAPTP